MTDPRTTVDHLSKRHRPRGLDTVYDRFEDSFAEGGIPRIEEALEQVSEPARREFLGDLLAVELTYRRRRGENPAEDDYLERFKEYVAIVRAAFDAVPEPSRVLLLAAFAIRLGLVSQHDMIAALETWVGAKHEPLGRLLVARELLTEAGLSLLENVLRDHLALHDGNPRRSLESIGLSASFRSAVEAIVDPELQSALAHIGVTVAEESASGPRFRIVDNQAREGGLGAVYKARDEQFGRIVALKQVRDRFAHDPEYRARLDLEGTVTGRLEHPSIVPAYARGRLEDGRPYYIMRYIEGPSLLDAIEQFHVSDARRRNPSERVLSLRRLLEQFVAVCRAIDYAHSRNVVHRDLKPQNVLLRNHYQFGETLVADWGLATFVDPPVTGEESAAQIVPSLEAAKVVRGNGTPLGTLQYMAPEQARGESTRSSDIFGLGATLYHTLTGSSPYQVAGNRGEDGLGLLEQVKRCEYRPPRQVNPRVSRALEAVCLKAMSPKPFERYATPRELADEVEHWLAGERVSVYDPVTVRLSRWVRRHQLAVACLVASVLFALTVGWLDARAKTYRVLSETNFGLLRTSVFSLMDTLARAEIPQVPQSRDLLLRMGRLFAAESQKVLDARGNNDELRRDVAQVYRKAGNLLRFARDLNGSLKYYHDAIQTLDGLNPGFGSAELREDERNRVLFLCDIGENLRLLGRYQEAREPIAEALQKLQKLETKFPGQPQVRELDAIVHVYRGCLQDDTGDDAGARQSYDRAVMRLPELRPGEYQDWRLWALAWLGQACSLEKQGQGTQAMLPLDQTIGLLSGREAKPDSGKDATFLLAQAFHERGRVQAMSPSQSRNAASDLEKALSRLLELTEHTPWLEDYTMELAATYNDRGSLRLTQSAYEDAEADFQAAMSKLENLLADETQPPGTQTRARRELGRTLFNLARVARIRRDPGATQAWLERALDVQENVVQSHPEGHQADRRLLEAYKNWRTRPDDPLPP